MHEVGRWQVDAIDAIEQRPHVAAAVEREHAAEVGPEVGEQEAAVGAQRDAVGAKRPVARQNGRIQRPRAVGAQVGDAAAPVGRVQIAAGRGQDALRTLESGADEAQCLQRDHRR